MIPLIQIPKFVEDVIRKCLKKGRDILDSLTPTSVDILHAAVGISTEAGELEKAVWLARSHKSYHPMDRFGDYIRQEDDWTQYWAPQYGIPIDLKNVREEMGDHQFYFNSLLMSMDAYVEDLTDPCTDRKRIPGLWHSRLTPEELIRQGKSSPRELLCDLVSIHSIIAGDILDLVKKHVIYNKPLDTKKEGESLSLEEKLLALLANDHWVQYQMAVVIGTTLEDIQKENEQKLSKGANARYKEGYSDKAAHDRADKADEDDGHEVNEVTKVNK